MWLNIKMVNHNNSEEIIFETRGCGFKSHSIHCHCFVVIILGTLIYPSNFDKLTFHCNFLNSLLFSNHIYLDTSLIPKKACQYKCIILSWVCHPFNKLKKKLLYAPPQWYQRQIYKDSKSFTGEYFNCFFTLYGK